jgi:flavodoxin
MSNKVKHAQELFNRLSAGDTRGSGGAQFMARDIREELRKAGKDVSALDPSGKRSASEMAEALIAATSAQQVKHAQDLFRRLSAGDTRGYGGAQLMARDIREELREAGKDVSALDPSGKRSASEMAEALIAATSAKQVKHAQELFSQLSAGDTTGRVVTLMARDIREELRKAGKDVSALDPSGKRSASEMAEALIAATSAQQVKHAQELFRRLSAGDTRDYGGARFMALDIREELSEAGKDLSVLDPAGKKSNAEVERVLNGATLAAEKRTMTQKTSGPRIKGVPKLPS